MKNIYLLVGIIVFVAYVCIVGYVLKKRAPNDSAVAAAWTVSTILIEVVLIICYSLS